jgi:hypothetical protein
MESAALSRNHMAGRQGSQSSIIELTSERTTAISEMDLLQSLGRRRSNHEIIRSYPITALQCVVHTFEILIRQSQIEHLNAESRLGKIWNAHTNEMKYLNERQLEEVRLCR